MPLMKTPSWLWPSEVIPTFSMPEWHASAACRDVDTDIFFPELGGTSRPARAVFATRSVRSECLEQGLDEDFGIWGGTSPRERRALKREDVA